MAILDMSDVQQIIDQINRDDEESRRQSFRRRGRIYKDGGKDFLIEYLEQEFGAQALNEMRLAPINVLKSWVDRKSIIYARPAVRTVEGDSDKKLMDYYADRMALDVAMQKANRYYNLYSNCELYILPKARKDGLKDIQMRVMPPWLYSVSTNAMDPSEKDAVIYSSFLSKDQELERKEIQDVSVIQQDRGPMTSPPGEGIDSQQTTSHVSESSTPYIFWTDEQHFTSFGNQIFVDPNNPDGINPIGMMPSVTLRKDVDNEFWAMQGEDLVDMAIATQLMYTDQLTIAKQQGFSLLTIISSEQPKKLEVGLQKAVWLKQKEGEPTPSIGYVSANAPIAEYSALSDRVLEVSSASNLLPSTLFAGGASPDANSGLQEMIKQSATLMEIESQKPVLRDAELESWERIAAWHNLLHDKNELPQEARELGKFSEDFAPQISYQDMKPIESEEQRLNQTKLWMEMGMLSKVDALQKLKPELTEEQAASILEKVQEERVASAERFGLPMNSPSQQQPQSGEEDEDA